MRTKENEKRKKITQLQKNFIEFKNKSHKNRDNNHNYDLITESDLNQIENLLQEYSTARAYLDENYSHIDPTILAMIYKRILNATPRWAPKIYTFRSFDRITSSRNKDVYGKLIIDKSKNSKYPRLLEEQRKVPRKYAYSILKIPLHHLSSSIKKYRKDDSTKIKLVGLAIIGDLLSIFSTALIPFVIPLIVCVLCTVAGIFVYPKGLKSNIGSTSVSKKSVSAYEFSGMLSTKQPVLISYYTMLKDKKVKQESPIHHLKQIKNQGTSWDSIEKKENS